MTHQPGETITIASYNDIITQVNTIFGTGTGTSGYGGNSANVSVTNLPIISAGATINNQEWLDLRNAQADVAAHQGTTLPAAIPSVTDLEVADLIQAFDDQTGPDNPAGEIDSAANLAIMVTNKDLVDAGNLITISRLINERTIPWSDFIQHEFTVDFGSSGNARFFFNTGGQLRLSASRTDGGETPQNTAWTDLLSANSPYIFTSADYFALTSDLIAKQSVSSDGVYAANNWTISAKRDDAAGSNGGNGSIIRFKSSFLDGYTNVFFDTVDGTFTSTVEDRRSIGVFSRPAPIYTDIIGVGATIVPPGGTTAFTSPGNDTYIVPAGVTEVQIKVWWDGGGDNISGGQAGAGGYVKAILDVTPGETLNITVGARGQPGTVTTPTSGTNGSGGGGGSAVLRGATELMIGGGGGGDANSAAGGGGGLIAGDGSFTGPPGGASPGIGGNQFSAGDGGAGLAGPSGSGGFAGASGSGGFGGAGGNAHIAGSGAGDAGGAGHDSGGNGGLYSVGQPRGAGGGGGGGGFFGGGGGGGRGNGFITGPTDSGGGGGGGSSFIDPSATNTDDENGQSGGIAGGITDVNRVGNAGNADNDGQVTINFGTSIT